MHQKRTISIRPLKLDYQMIQPFNSISNQIPKAPVTESTIISFLPSLGPPELKSATKLRKCQMRAAR